MNWVDFGILLNENTPLYILLLIVSLALYVLVFKKVYISFLDPFIFTLVFSVFGFAVILFLFFTNNIDNYYFYSYLFTQLAFWIGFFSYKQLNKYSLEQECKIVVFDDQTRFLKLFIKITALLYVVLQIASYVLVGMPVLMESHVNTYSESGFGILGRFLDVLKPTVIFLLFYFAFLTKPSFRFKIFAGIMSIVILLFFILSGSKSEFMLVGQILFCVLIMNASSLKKQFDNIRKYERYIVISALAFVFIVIIIQSFSGERGDLSALDVFIFRMVSSGDTYYFTYPGKVIEQLDGSSPFLALFGNLFTTIRVIPKEAVPESLGITIFNLFYTADSTIGPNARHNVFGYVYFGFYGSILFSFFIGWLLSFVRNKMFFRLKNNVLKQLIFVFLYIELAKIETDPPSSFSNLENTLLIFPIIFMTIHFVYVTSTKLGKYS